MTDPVSKARALCDEVERAGSTVGEARLIRAIMGDDTTTADRLAAICHAEWLRRATAALRVAAAELEWGHREMNGRPPEHWTAALDEVRRVLASGPSGIDPGKVKR